MAEQQPKFGTYIEGITNKFDASRYIERWREHFYPAFAAEEISADRFGVRVYKYRQHFYNLMGMMHRRSMRDKSLADFMGELLNIRMRDMHSDSEDADPQAAQDTVFAASEMAAEVAGDLKYSSIPVNAFRGRGAEMTILFETLQELVTAGKRWPKKTNMREFQLDLQMVEERVMQALMRGEWHLPPETRRRNVLSWDEKDTMPNVGDNHVGIDAVMKHMVYAIRWERPLLTQILHDEEGLDIYALIRNIVRQRHIIVPGGSHWDQ